MKISYTVVCLLPFLEKHFFAVYGEFLTVSAYHSALNRSEKCLKSFRRWVKMRSSDLAKSVEISNN